MSTTQPTLEPEDDETRIDRFVLNLLLDEDNQRPRSIEEVIREHGNQPEALDGLDRLHGAGLIHRIDGYVFASRAAIRLTEIGG
jgi:hypothetical protein